jgi:hypothetical protein
MHFKGINRGKKWFKNDSDLSILMQKIDPKVKMHKFAQEMTTVDGGHHPRLYPSVKETWVIFGYCCIDENSILFRTNLEGNVLNFQ